MSREIGTGGRIGLFFLLVASGFGMGAGVFGNGGEDAPARVAEPRAVPVEETLYLVVHHDDGRRVTCWSKGSHSLSCLPDWMLTAPGMAPGMAPKVTP